MENEETTKTPLKTRLKAHAKKIAPYAIGFFAGAGFVAINVLNRENGLLQTISEKIEDDTIVISEIENGSFTISEVPPKDSKD